MLRQAPAGFIGFFAVVEFLHGFDGAGKGLPDFVEHVAKACSGVGVLDELARGGGMRDVAYAGFLENAVIGNSKADDAAKVFRGEVAFTGEVGEGD